MAHETWGWLVVLLLLIALVLLVAGIVTVRATWNDSGSREAAMIWLYVALIVIFVAALIAAALQSNKVEVYRLPYSQQAVRLTPIDYDNVHSNY